MTYTFGELEASRIMSQMRHWCGEPLYTDQSERHPIKADADYIIALADRIKDERKVVP